MSKAAHELYRALKKFTTPDASVIPGIVKAINDDGTIEVDVGGVVYPDVLLQASINEGQKGIKVKPAIDSLVMMERIGDSKSDEMMVVLFSEIDQHSIEIGSAEWGMDKEGFLIKKGNDTLLQALELIVEGIMPIIVLKGRNPNYAKLQQALTKIKNLLK